MIREEVLSYFESFVKDLPEIYQDIEIGGEVAWQGKRVCKPRWEVIKPLIKPGTVVLVLGSATGYFAIKIAKEFPSCTVISVECGAAEAELQKEILLFEKLTNVVLLNKRLDIQDFQELARIVEGVDLVLALSVLHHFPEPTVLDILRVLSHTVPEIIAEVPGPGEVEACGQNTIRQLAPFDEVLSGFYATVKELGSVPSHLGNYERGLYHGRRIVSRGGLLAYWDCPNTIKLHRISKLGGEWKVDGKPGHISGVNVWTLLHLNPVWPYASWWQEQARAAWGGLVKTGEFISDCRPWNMLFTSAGLCAIDFKGKFPKGDLAEFHPGDIDKLEKLFTFMEPREWGSL